MIGSRFKKSPLSLWGGDLGVGLVLKPPIPANNISKRT